MKHAFLILAHNEFALLQTLIGCLDDARNDIYVHIDRKVRELPALHAAHARLVLLDRRIDVRWGDYSVVEAEYALFETAQQGGPYAYYHLLSGVDLPLRSQDAIHAFFDANQGKEFIAYTSTEMSPEMVRKVRRWHLFPRDFRNKSHVRRALRAAFLRLQERLGIERNRDVDFKKGSQWVSVTESMARYFIDHRKWVQKVFTHTFCADEMVFQTLCWQSPMRHALYNTTDDGLGCMRTIGWHGDKLTDWSAADYDTLAHSFALFARKFNSSDPDFIRKIVALSAE